MTLANIQFSTWLSENQMCSPGWNAQDSSCVKGCLPVTNSLYSPMIWLQKMIFGVFLHVQNIKMVSPLFPATSNKISQGSNWSVCICTACTPVPWISIGPLYLLLIGRWALILREIEIGIDHEVHLIRLLWTLTYAKATLPVPLKCLWWQMLNTSWPPHLTSVCL